MKKKTISFRLQHHKSNTTEVLIQLVLAIHAASNVVRAVVKQVVMQLPIATAKLLLLQE